jgi:hypothetical protein
VNPKKFPVELRGILPTPPNAAYTDAVVGNVISAVPPAVPPYGIAPESSDATFIDEVIVENENPASAHVSKKIDAVPVPANPSRASPLWDNTINPLGGFDTIAIPEPVLEVNEYEGPV